MEKIGGLIKKREDINIQFGKRLRELRVQQNLSAEQVARMTGVVISTYREWENGRAITGQPYIQMATALRVSVYQLFGIEDTRKDEIASKLNKIDYLLQEIRNIL